MKKAILLFVLFFIFYFSFSQNLDSLLTVARDTKNDSAKISMYNKIAFSYIFNNTEKAIQVINEGKQFAKGKDLFYGFTELTNTHGIYMDITGKSDSAKYYFSEALKFSREHNFKGIESRCINNLGMYNWNSGNYNEALRYFFESLKMDEKKNNRKSTAIKLNNIGLIYQEMNLSEKALDYHQKALKIRKEFNLKKEQVASLNNIGICYKELGKLSKAINIYNEGIEIAKSSDNLLDYYKILDNLANAYQVKEDYNKAIETYLLALNRPKDYKGDEKSNISIYSNIVSAYNRVNNPQKGLHFATKGFEIIKRYPQFKYYSGDLFLNAAESYYMINNFNTARAFTQKFVILKDSLFSEKNAKAIADLEIKYETEKKEKQILIQRADIAEQGLTIQKRNYQLYGLVGLALILSLIGYLFYNQQKLKNKQLQKENELKDALLKIETQNRLQEQRLRISRDLHDNIGAQLTFIISSLDNLKYGFKIDDEKLTGKLESISTFTSDTIYELRDTIWAMNKSKITFEDLKTRITNFIDKANLTAINTKFEFICADNIVKEKAFTSVEGMNIYRIIQESVNNAIKYAEAKKISVNVFSIDQVFHINIKDNGKGFDVSNVELGNGLNNIKKRSKEIHAELDINSIVNVGTTIKLTKAINT